jgi:hypothetical protein
MTFIVAPDLSRAYLPQLRKWGRTALLSGLLVAIIAAKAAAILSFAAAAAFVALGRKLEQLGVRDAPCPNA